MHNLKFYHNSYVASIYTRRYIISLIRIKMQKKIIYLFYKILNRLSRSHEYKSAIYSFLCNFSNGSPLLILPVYNTTGQVIPREVKVLARQPNATTTTTHREGRAEARRVRADERQQRTISPFNEVMRYMR